MMTPTLLICKILLTVSFLQLTEMIYHRRQFDCGGGMEIRILLVDDFEPWRHFVRSIIQEDPELQIICEVSDGLAAIQKANELKPDLILMDIGLPKLDGMAAARRICTTAPKPRILFVTADSSEDVAREALRIGAGILFKGDTPIELLGASKAVIRGERFVSSRFASQLFGDHEDLGVLTSADRD
jgi:DNA-binding NarL/FixJ family response regulator